MLLKYINMGNYSKVKQVLIQEFGISANLMKKLRKSKKVFLNGESCYIDSIINANDVVSVDINFDEDNDNIVSTKMDLDILFEDDGMLIINKPAGIPVHPSILHFEDSLSNGVKYYFDSLGLHRKIRPVNRLDRNTSGIVIFAKNEYVQECLSKQMQSKIFKKEYLAICRGKFKQKEGTINAPIARKEDSIIERCVDKSGDIAITHYKVIKEINNSENSGLSEPISELLINLETGRTHQIRVHMAYIGHPILGDSLYGERSTLIDRQTLHAFRVEFLHPITKEKMEVFASIPDDMNSGCFFK